MYKAILENLDKLWKWIKNISTLDYGALLKNFIVAVLIIVVCFLSLNINLIVSSPLFVLEIIGMVILVFFIVQLIGDIHRKITDKKEIKSVSKRILFQEEIQSRLINRLEYWLCNTQELSNNEIRGQYKTYYDQLKKFLGKTSKEKINSQLEVLYTSLNDKEFLKRLQLQVARRKANLK